MTSATATGSEVPRVSGLIAGVRSVPRLVLVAALRVYQSVISPMTGPTCRYYPSCSSYALIAVQRHGAVRGTWLAARRLLRCHPWAAGGVDDVPPVRNDPQTTRHDGNDERPSRSTAA
ncbi:membrane protein insertion efficiency factor YidD [Actinotalea sp. BY-33]|uniref:Putative membrane protein insertion efficiency factor n=1 Tax=Actinotalea soli TaxID=2819234 RepID=A0A939LTT5_9CELL|nr:membrane protein insertion efficiency factor YidD [Actinotalea soli]MBO1751172.1 membrane protein insertion efficiency factor YidD [Actinotalea soli]